MRVNTLLLGATAVGIFVGAAGYGVVGPSCLERQERGNVTSMVGVVEPGQVVSTSVPYDLRGSENDISINWDGRGTAGGPHIHVYATNTGCSEFVPPPPGSGSDVDPNTGACRIIARCSGFTLAPDARPCAQAHTCEPTAVELTCDLLTVTGPGNGAPPGFSEYVLHVVGDRTLRVR